MTKKADIQAHRAAGSWRSLEQVAHAMVADASQAAGRSFPAILGGGTRLMLAIEHRISDDIDLFIRDPQWINYLSPRLNDRFEGVISGYDEGASTLKFRFPQGEVDFIVGMSLLGLPNEKASDCLFELEPVAEVLAKKLFYRGWALTPRDLYDWRMLECSLPEADLHMPQIAKVIGSRVDQIQLALSAMESSAQVKLRWSEIRGCQPLDLQETIAWGKDRLSALQRMEATASDFKLVQTLGTSVLTSGNAASGEPPQLVEAPRPGAGSATSPKPL